MAYGDLKWYMEIERTVRENESRIKQLEKHIHYPHNENAYVRGVDAMKEAAAKAQAGYIPGWPDVDPRQKYGDTRPASEQMKEAAAKAQAQTVISEAYTPQPPDNVWKKYNPYQATPPMRADTEAILALTKFAKRLLTPDDLGHAVTLEVRQLARRALGLPEVKEYDL